MGEIQTISNPSSREFLYSRHADFTDKIEYFLTAQDFIIPYGRYRHLICHSGAMFLKLQIVALEWVGAYQLMILGHIKERLQNFEKRLLASSCLSVRLSVRPHGATGLLLDGFS